MQRKKTLPLILISFFLFNFNSVYLSAKEKKGLKLKPVKITFGMVGPKGSIYERYMRKIKIELRKKSKGRIKLIIYAGGRVGDDLQMAKKVKKGTLKSALLTGVGIGKIYPPAKVFDLPLYFKSTRQFQYVVKKTYPYLEKEMKKRGVILTGYGTLGHLHFGAKKQIRDLNDLKGMRVWNPPGERMVKVLFTNFGIVPKYVKIIDVQKALAANKLDAIFSPPVAMIAFGWYKNLTHIMFPGITDFSLAILFNRAYFEKLSKADQKLIKKTCEKYMNKLSLGLLPANKRSVAALKKRGIKVVNLSKKALKEFKKKTLKTERDLIKMKLLDKKLLKMVKKYKKQYR